MSEQSNQVIPGSDGASAGKGDQSPEPQGNDRQHRQGETPGRYGKHYAVVKKNREFSFLFRKGETAGNPAFVVYYRQNNRRVNRLGIVTSKKVGNAVKRSRARRLLREAFRLSEPGLLSGTDKRFDLVVVARDSLPAMKMQEVKLRLQRVFSRMMNPNSPSGSRNRPAPSGARSGQNEHKPKSPAKRSET